MSRITNDVRAYSFNCLFRINVALRNNLLQGLSHYFNQKIWTTMKKLLSIVFLLSLTGAAMAQSSRQQSRDVILGQRNDRVYSNSRDYDYRMTARERDEQIQRINREYNWRIERVKRDYTLRNGQKNRQVRQLEKEKKEAIQDVRERFARSQHNDRRYERRNDNRW